ncbi:MAG: GAF domain-containing protein [Marinilabiliaceae bacterium]|nr:GAF domain-containing protein [Marinilabiliaceae bacterium]
MSKISHILSILKSDCVGLCSILKTWLVTLWGKILASLVWCGKLFGRMAEWFKAIPIMRRVFIVLSIYMVAFFIWQMFAYSVPQPLFVIINLIFVTLLSGFLCYVMFSTRNAINTLNDKLIVAVSMRKRKEKEVATLKTEIHNYKLASRNQSTFGKNSQALIDSVHKYKQEQVAGELKGQYILRALALNYEVCCGIIYMKNPETGDFDIAGQFALTDEPKYMTITSEDGLAGEVIKSGKPQYIEEIPTEFITVSSGLGHTTTLEMCILPLKRGDSVEAVVEVASFGHLSVIDFWQDVDSLLLN